ncbi:MAG: sulfatase [Planctomycetota bacterium]
MKYRMTRRNVLAGLGVGAAGILMPRILTAQDAAGTGGRRPNFIFILNDDHGWAETSVRMHPNIAESCCPYLETPNIERLAMGGMRFSSGYAPAPICTPTRRGVLCGKTPARLRGTEFPCDPPDFFDPAQHLTIPKALKAVDSNYRCAHFGKWGELIPAPNLAGYDASDGETGNITGGGMADEDRKRQPLIAPEPKDDPKLIFSMTKRAMDFMEKQVGEKHPFFMQVSYYAAHHQIQARAATVEKYRKKGQPPRDFPLEWAAMLEDLDTGIGQLLDKIDALGIADSTYVFLSADNGGAPHEKDDPLYVNRLAAAKEGATPAAGARLPENYPLRGAKQWLYEGGIRVPFIARGPRIKAGGFSHVPVAQYDLLPTFVDLAGGKGPLPAEVDGGSLRAVLENEGKGDVKRALPGLVFHRPQRGYSAFRSGDLKLVVNWTEGKKELYDLSTDIGEQNDLAATMPDKTAALYDILTNYLASVNAEKFDAAKTGKGKRKRKAGPKPEDKK